MKNATSSPLIIGIDEAGRGPWAGPVVAAAVILPNGMDQLLFRDSKQLTAQKREELFKVITQYYPYGVGVCDTNTIDSIGIKKATNQAMNDAVKQLVKTFKIEPAKTVQSHIQLLIDGNDKFTFPYAHISLIKGDEKIPAISAASIVAKVTRDNMMRGYHKQYPVYAFDTHKGYGTKQHYQALQQNGICPLHRRTYKPIATIINQHKPKLLLHICCAVDAGWPIQKLIDQYDITCYFYDPNIHPEKEYIKRKNEMKKIIKKFKTVKFVEGPYEPALFFKRTKGLEWEPEKGKRCDVCCDLLLEKTAKYANKKSFQYFTTTLSTSPRKEIVRISKYGKKWEVKTGIPYLDENFKKENGYLKTLNIVKELNIYQQQYCGCVFSMKNPSLK